MDGQRDETKGVEAGRAGLKTRAARGSEPELKETSSAGNHAKSLV